MSSSPPMAYRLSVMVRLPMYAAPVGSVRVRSSRPSRPGMSCMLTVGAALSIAMPAEVRESIMRSSGVPLSVGSSTCGRRMRRW